jgi:hypothetical protein
MDHRQLLKDHPHGKERYDIDAGEAANSKPHSKRGVRQLSSKRRLGYLHKMLKRRDNENPTYQ